MPVSIGLIATTRTPEKLADFAERGVIVRPADFDNPASLAEAFAGADRLLLIPTDALDGTDRRQRQHKAAIQAAENAGVNHIVYLSLVNPTDTPVLLAPDHAVTEAALAASLFHYQELNIHDLKTYLHENGVSVRLTQTMTETVTNGQPQVG